MDRVKIDSKTGCWMWSGACFSRGYGAIPYNGKNPGYAHRFSYELHHRFSYELHHGPIPEGAVIMHRCDRKRCVNPAHLRAGTQKQNIHDAMNKGRWMTDKRKKYLRNAPQNFRFGQPKQRTHRNER